MDLTPAAVHSRMGAAGKGSPPLGGDEGSPPQATTPARQKLQRRLAVIAMI
jgi:hypothetical protein